MDEETRPDNLQTLMRALGRIPVSTAKRKRDFSVMNLIATDLRSSLTNQNISHLMMIHITGLPLEYLNPAEYARRWVQHHRSVDDTK